MGNLELAKKDCYSWFEHKPMIWYPYLIIEFVTLHILTLPKLMWGSIRDNWMRARGGICAFWQVHVLQLILVCLSIGDWLRKWLRHLGWQESRVWPDNFTYICTLNHCRLVPCLWIQTIFQKTDLWVLGNTRPHVLYWSIMIWHHYTPTL